MSEGRRLHSKNSKKTTKRPGKNDKLPLSSGLFSKSIFEVLPVGVVAFGPDLEITDASSKAAQLIELADRIDKSLSRGTDSKIWHNWTETLASVLSTGQVRTFENVGYTLKGQVRLLRIVCAPLKTSKTGGDVSGVIVIEDVTEKVNLQKQLVNTEKLATVGRLASRVVHELNNPMDGILRYINLAMRIVEQENLEKPREYLAQCRQGVMRMVQIVSELLEFSRGTYTSFECVKIEQVIEDATKMMASSAEASNVRITAHYAPDIPKIRTGSLFQVFCNLLKNAVDAMPAGGELDISTHLIGGDTAVVEFRDTGAGFPPENAEVMFEPFFTTKDKGKGTGLGLAICKDIIERYKGRITAENAPAGGSIFTVYLPVTGENP